MNKKILLFFCLAICVYNSWGQQKTILIQVRTVRSEPVESATIRLKNTPGAIGVTDNEGNASISAQQGQILLISSINMQAQEVLVGLANRYTVTLLENTTTLEDVVITALGIERKRNSLPYATQQIDQEELNRVPSNNFIQQLSGKVAGLQITSNNTLGGTNNVILRGFKSLTQSNQALFVVDGVPIDNSNNSRNGLDLGNAAADINPEDIAAVNVLKGAAASALYGSRAVNGVIMITTKKKNKGAPSSDIVVNQSVRSGWLDNTTLPTYQTLYGQGKGSAGYNAAYPERDGFFYYVPAIGSGGQPVPVVITNQDLAWGPRYDPDLAVYNWDAFVPGNPNYAKATPWVAGAHSKAADYFQTPLASNTSVLVNTSQERSTFKVGYTNNYERGISPNSYSKKNVVNFSGTYDVTERLTVGASVNYSNALANNRSSYDYRSANTNVRDLRQWNPSNIDYEALRADYDRGYNASWNIVSGQYNQVLDEPIKAAYHNNPYWNDYENYNNDNRDRYFGYVQAVYRLVPGLQATARVSRDSYTQKFENRIAVGSYQTSLYSRSDVRFAENNLDFLLNYQKNLTEKLNLQALAGVNIRRTYNESTSSATSGGLLVPGLYALSNSVATPDAPIEYDGIKQVNGYFAGATFDYNETLSLDVTGRVDRSSALPQQHNTYFYPAVSGGFTFSKWLADAHWLSFGKLRLNYAEVGGDAPIYSVQNTYVAGTPFNGQNVYTNPLTNNNPDLKPERSRSYEAGLELSFLANRINLDVTYYHSRLNNQITPIIPSAATGYTNFYVNGGTIQNQGLEVLLNVVPVKQEHFQYELSINWSKNNNKVISLYGGQSAYTIASYHNSVQLVAEVGKAYGILRGSDYEYLNGKPLVDDEGYYVKSANANSDIGSILPDWRGGITNRFTYKNFALSFLIDVSKGGDVYSLDIDNGSRSGVLAETAAINDLGNNIRDPLSAGGGIILDGVKADGTPNDIRIDLSDANKLGSKLPFGSTNASAARSYVFDASYVKLREVAFSYNLPKDLFARSRFVKGATFTVAGRNLWIIHKNLPYADPEQGAPSTTLTNADPMVYQANASIGYQNGVFPTVREVSLSASIHF